MTGVSTASRPLEEEIGFLGQPPGIRWSAVFGGAVAGIAIWTTLYVLGLALGFSSIDQANADNLRASGLFSGVWSVIAPLVALFAGGAIASRGARVARRSDGVLHGIVVWALATLAAIYLIVNLFSALLSGVFSVGKTAVEAGGSAASGVARGAGAAGGLANFALDPNDALGAINQRLRAAGKPEVSADQLQAAAKDVVAEAVRQGRFDKDLLTRSLVEHNILTQNDANEVAGRVEAQFNAAKDKLGGTASGVGQAVQGGAVKAAHVTGKAFWGIFAVLFLGLASAIFGATMGVSKRIAL